MWILWYAGHMTMPNYGSKTALIVGSLLGDMSLSTNKNQSKARLRVVHGPKQKDLVERKYELLKDWCGTPPRRAVNRGFGDSVWSFSTLLREDLLPMRNLLYPDGEKALRVDVLERYWSAEMLAWWVMDDGTSQPGRMLCLQTESFPYHQQIEAANWLESAVGLKASVCKSKRGRWRMLLSVEASELAAQKVAPFILPSMQYKVSKLLEERPRSLCWVCSGELDQGRNESYKSYRSRRYCTKPTCLAVQSLKAGGHYRNKSPSELGVLLRTRRCARCNERISPNKPLSAVYCSKECRQLSDKSKK